MPRKTFFCTQITLPHGTTYAEIQAASTDTTLLTEGRFLKKRKSRKCVPFFVGKRANTLGIRNMSFTTTVLVFASSKNIMAIPQLGHVNVNVPAVIHKRLSGSGSPGTTT